MKPTLSYCGMEVYKYDRDRFLAALFIPAPSREAFFCFCALNLELARIPELVSEEMIGHIRYAWWQESIEEIYSGGKAKGQPVLRALAETKLPQHVVMKLVTSYREHFPNPPPHVDAIFQSLLQKLCPEAEKSWRKAGGIIAGHRKRYGQKWNGWLMMKLLIPSPSGRGLG